jgi:hypothetical protein
VIFLILFDPVLDAKRKKEEPDSEPTSQNIICYHCYGKILGKIYYFEDKPFDKFCWQFRYVILPEDKESDEKKKKMEEALEKLRAERDLSNP